MLLVRLFLFSLLLEKRETTANEPSVTPSLYIYIVLIKTLAPTCVARERCLFHELRDRRRSFETHLLIFGVSFDHNFNKRVRFQWPSPSPVSLSLQRPRFLGRLEEHQTGNSYLMPLSPFFVLFQVFSSILYNMYVFFFPTLYSF